MKIKYPSFLVRVIIRFWKQSFKDYLMIVQQELRFSKMLKTCVPISVDDLYKILQYYGHIQERSDKGEIIHSTSLPFDDRETVHQLMEQYGEYIQLPSSNQSNPPVHDTRSIREQRKSNRKGITISNLVIYLTDKYEEQMRPPKLVALNFYSNGKLEKSTDLNFSNCIVTINMDTSSIDPNRSLFWKFEKSENSVISFTNCVFRGTHICIEQKSDPDEILDGRSIGFYNTFATSIDGGFWINTRVDNNLKTVDLPQENFPIEASFKNISVDNCQFGFAYVSNIDLSLTGNNVLTKFLHNTPEIKYILVNGKLKKINLNEFSESKGRDKYRVYWGPYQAILPEALNWEGHKAWLLELKAIAEKKGDYSQRDILRREIMKCDRELIRQEPWFISWQDRLTLWFNATFSNYGISWVRPLALLASVNFLYSLLIVHAAHDGCCSADWGLLHVFLESFNPLYTPELLDKDGKSCVSALLLGAGLLHKLFFAICVYEIIRAARRFSRQ